MRNLVNWLGKVNIDEVKRLVTDTYNTFNGIINPINKSQELVLSDRKVHIGFMQDLIAFAHFNSIELNIESLCKRYRGIEILAMAGLSVKKANEMFATTLIDLVVHELSHLDQKYSDYLGLNLTEFGIMYCLDVERFEQANAWHTREFIESNKDLIKDKLDVELNYKYCKNLSVYYLRGKKEKYSKIDSLEDVVDWVFTQITGNVRKTLNPVTIMQYGIKKFGVIIDKRFYDLANPKDLMFIDSHVRYSRKKFGVSQPTVYPLIETGEYVAASELIDLGEMTNVINKCQSEEFVYNYEPKTATV